MLKAIDIERFFILNPRKDKDNMTAQEIQEKMRAKLHKIGLTPTDRGEREARRTQKKMRQETHDALEQLAPRDLFSVWLIVGELTRIDPPLPPHRKDRIRS